MIDIDKTQLKELIRICNYLSSTGDEFVYQCAYLLEEDKKLQKEITKEGLFYLKFLILMSPDLFRLLESNLKYLIKIIEINEKFNEDFFEEKIYDVYRFKERVINAFYEKSNKKIDAIISSYKPKIDVDES